MGVHSRCSEVHHGGHPQGIRCRAPSVCAPLEKISEGKSKRCVLAAPRSEPKQTPKNTAEKTNQTNCSVLQPPISSLAENREESNAQPRVAWRDVCVFVCVCVLIARAPHMRNHTTPAPHPQTVARVPSPTKGARMSTTVGKPHCDVLFVRRARKKGRVCTEKSTLPSVCSLKLG